MCIRTYVSHIPIIPIAQLFLHEAFFKIKVSKTTRSITISKVLRIAKQILHRHVPYYYTPIAHNLQLVLHIKVKH